MKTNSKTLFLDVIAPSSLHPKSRTITSVTKPPFLSTLLIPNSIPIRALGPKVDSIRARTFARTGLLSS